MAGPGTGDTSLEDRGDRGSHGLVLAASRPRSIKHFDDSDKPAWTYTTIVTDQPDGSCSARRPGIVVGTTVKIPADQSTRYTVYYLFPLDDVQQTLAPGDPRPADRRRPAAGADRRADLAADPPDRDADPDGPAGGRAAGGRAAPGAAPGDRRGRPGAPRDVVQPDGDQPAAPDPAAGGAEPRAAAVRLRRVPRAAHPADHGAAGRLGAARRQGRLRPRRRPAPPSCCSGSSTGSRPCWSTCWRSAGSTPAPRPSTWTT